MDSIVKPKSIVLEVTSHCNNDCMYCYNVWKSPYNTYPEGQMPLSDVIRIIDKINEELPYLLVANSGVGSEACKNVIDALLEEFPNSDIIFLGTAGAINHKLNLGDVVVADTPVSWESSVDKRLIPKNVFGATCSKLNSPGIKRGDEKYSFKIFGGNVVSWDTPVFDDTVKSWLFGTAGAHCVDMETGYVAQLCKKKNLSFLTIRGISDMASDDKRDLEYSHKIHAVWNATIVALEVISSAASVSMWPINNL